MSLKYGMIRGPSFVLGEFMSEKKIERKEGPTPMNVGDSVRQALYFGRQYSS